MKMEIKKTKVEIKKNQTVLFSNIKLANSFYDRLIGLMFKKEIHDGEGLLIDPCRSIHTCFMRYHLDIVFLDRKNRVVKILRDLPPWRLTWIYFKASKTLELPAGKLPFGIKEGDLLEVTNV